MTLHVTRSGQKVTINGNTGVDLHMENSQLHHVRITEDAQHARWFYNQLGQALDEADAERTAALALEIPVPSPER